MNNLKILRKMKDLRQEDLAKELNVQNPTISYWENGKMPIDEVHHNSLMKILNCSQDELIGLKKVDTKRIDTVDDIRRVNIMILMGRKRINNKKLSEEIGCSRQLISDYIGGNRDLSKDIFDKIAKSLISEDATIFDLEQEPKFLRPSLNKERDIQQFQEMAWEILHESDIKNMKERISMFPFTYDMIEDYLGRSNEEFENLRMKKGRVDIENKILNKILNNLSKEN